MLKSRIEWQIQADYDFDTATFMFNGGRYFYTIFMCHLALEKALKGLYEDRLGKEPPKTHDLLLLVGKIGLPNMPKRIGDLIKDMSTLSVPTRYPDTLAKVKHEFKKVKTQAFLKKTEKALAWLKTQ